MECALDFDPLEKRAACAARGSLNDCAFADVVTQRGFGYRRYLGEVDRDIPERLAIVCCNAIAADDGPGYGVAIGLPW